MVLTEVLEILRHILELKTCSLVPIFEGVGEIIGLSLPKFIQVEHFATDFDVLIIFHNGKEIGFFLLPCELVHIGGAFFDEFSKGLCIHDVLRHGSVERITALRLPRALGFSRLTARIQRLAVRHRFTGSVGGCRNKSN